MIVDPPIAAQPAEAIELPYVSVSPAKILLLSTATFGLYMIWWFYQQWRHVRRVTGARMQPLARAIFAPLFCFALFRDVEEDLNQHGMALPVPGLVLGLGVVATSMVSRAPDFYWLLALLVALPLMAAQTGINRLHAGVARAAPPRLSLGFGGGVALSLGAIAWMLVIFGMFSTDSQIRLGSELKSSELEFLQSMGYLDPDETVMYFYSAGLWSIREDGNILTDRRVIAYENVGADEYHEVAHFDEIFSVDVVYSDSWLDDSRVTVTTVHNREVLLLLSTEKRRDRAFVERLVAEWRKRVPEGEERLLVPDQPGVNVRTFTLS